MSLQVRTLLIGNPFWDKTARVSEDFIKQSQLTKGNCSLEHDLQQMRKLWQRAKNPQEKIKGRCGGSGANLMLPLAMLGNNHCTILGRIGMDTHSQKIEKRMAEIGVATMLLKSEDQVTGKVVCLIAPDEEPTMITHPGASGVLNPEDIIKEKVQGHNHWHIEGYVIYNHIMGKCIKIAKEGQATLSINLPKFNVIEQMRGEFETHIKEFNYILGNLEEIQTLTGMKDIHQACREYFGIDQEVAITDGARGCWIKAKGKSETQHFNAVKLEKLRNKTGAGDVWSGFYLALALQGKSIAECVEMANLGVANWLQLNPGTYIESKTWESFKATVAKSF